MSLERDRWINFRKANDTYPRAREREFLVFKEITNPQNGDVILEAGTGNGNLTFILAGDAQSPGSVVTYDAIRQNIDNLIAKNTEKKLPVVAKLQRGDYVLDGEVDDSFDKVVSLASLHHYDKMSAKKRNQFSGTEVALGEFYRVLKPGGKLIISDVCHNTPVQEYFYAINNPRFCYPDGHPHGFLDRQSLFDLFNNTGFEPVEFTLRSVPWTFDNMVAAQHFTHMLHNAQCSPEELFELLRRYLPVSEDTNGQVTIDWELFFCVAIK